MLGGKESYLILGVALGFFGALVAFVYLDAAVVSLGYCGNEESYSICAREWIAALSGWAAFAGAAVALPLLAVQAKEARKQTEFAIGDADPEFMLARNAKHPNVVLTVTNWNRRRIMLDKIRVIEANDVKLMNVVLIRKSDGENVIRMTVKEDYLHKTRGVPRLGVNGWVDRAKEPHRKAYALGLQANGRPISWDRLLRSSLVIEVDYSVLGQAHENKRARVSTATVG